MNLQRREKKFFDVIDLDPYGTAVPFLESSFNALADGGLMAVTFTDMAVLCARQPHVCYYKYGGSPLNKRYCHEMALRIILHMLSQMANKHQKYIIPLVSLTVDFYVRLFLRVKEGPQKCHHSITKYSHVFQCLDCESFYMQPFGVHSEVEMDDKKPAPKHGEHKGKGKKAVDEQAEKDKVVDKDQVAEKGQEEVKGEE